MRQQILDSLKDIENRLFLQNGRIPWGSMKQENMKPRQVSSWHLTEGKEGSSHSAVNDQFISERSERQLPPTGRFQVTKVPRDSIISRSKSLSRSRSRSGSDVSGPDESSLIVPVSLFDEPIFKDDKKKRKGFDTKVDALSPVAKDKNKTIEDLKKKYADVFDSHTLTLYEDDIRGDETIDKVLQNTITADGKVARANLGTLFGVFLPCCQNIVGVIYFLRMPWIVGCGGILEAFAISLSTAISMSAIATNGRVTAGGTYFMISRSLGPTVGGSVGILFFMGTSISVAMYYLGTVEVLLTYVAPQLTLDENSADDESIRLNDYRLYGTILLLCMATVVFLGVTVVSRFAFGAIVFLVAALLSIFVGLFVAGLGLSGHIDTACALGDRLMLYRMVYVNGTMQCHKNVSGPIYNAYCHTPLNGTAKCEDFFLNNNASLVPVISGFSMDLIKAQLFSFYTKEGDIPGTNIKADTSRELHTDITTSFVFLISIYFPSITGVESGSNYSGDLRDPQVSIPRGTLSAVFVTSTLYLSSVILFGGSVEGMILRDKFGESVSHRGDMVLSLMAWPSKWIVLVGTLTATIGAGMQALAGGPRLLQAIAEDQILPALTVFAKKWRGEPIRCLFMTFLIAELGILIAFLDYVAPIVTMFFLMCYGFISFSVTLQSLVDTPHWRPRYKRYHWSFTLLGTALCLTTMFICDWRYALLAIVLAFALYQYIEYKGAEKEWGDGITGLSMSAALFALMRLKREFKHIKNWRPQFLVFLKMDMPDSFEIISMKEDMHLLMLASMMKEGRGLTVFGTVMKGSLSEKMKDKERLSEIYSNCLDESGVKGFIEIVINPSIGDGLSCLMQCAGLGALRPNTIIMGWPKEWTDNRNLMSYHIFLDTMRNIAMCHKAVVILKAVDFPTKSSRLTGTIDIWWVVNDGGMLLLLAHLLRRSKIWVKCKLRVFSVAQEKDNTVQIKKDLQTYLYQLRMDGLVEVLEMAESEMSAYVYERTLKLEERTRMLQKITKQNRRNTLGGGSKRLLGKEAQTVLENARSTVDMTSKREEMSTPIDAVNQNKPIPPSKENMRHMVTAVRLNAMMMAKSKDASLVILNLPCVPESSSGQANYMSFLEILTEGLDRLLLVRGTGSEVITVFN